MLPGIHYAGWREITEMESRASNRSGTMPPSVAGSHPVLIRPAVDLFLFVRNKLRDLRFASLEELPHERITVHLPEAGSIFNETETKLRHKAHIRSSMLGAHVETSSRAGRSLEPLTTHRREPK
jgi:hypothetical protein